MLRFDRFASLYVCNLEFVIFVFAIYYSELFERKNILFAFVSGEFNTEGKNRLLYCFS